MHLKFFRTSRRDINLFSSSGPKAKGLACYDRLQYRSSRKHYFGWGFCGRSGGYTYSGLQNDKTRLKTTSGKERENKAD